MKKVITVLSVLLVCLAVKAQTNDLMNSPWTSKLLSFEQNVEGNSNVTFGIYPSYAPKLINSQGLSDKWGAGIFATYNFKGAVGDHLFTGLRLDYLGSEFWAPSINGGLKADVQVLGHNFTPFAYTGAIVPVSGAGDLNGDWGIIYGGGVKTHIMSFKVFNKDASLDLGAAVERWDTLGKRNFDGPVYHIAPVFSVAW